MFKIVLLNSKLNLELLTWLNLRLFFWFIYMIIHAIINFNLVAIAWQIHRKLNKNTDKRFLFKLSFNCYFMIDSYEFIYQLFNVQSCYGKYCLIFFNIAWYTHWLHLIWINQAILIHDWNLSWFYFLKQIKSPI